MTNTQPVPTSHPSPDGISDATKSFDAALARLREDFDARCTGHADCPVPHDVVDALSDAYGTLVRGASEDRARLDWIDAQWQEPIHIEVDGKTEYPNGPIRREVTVFTWGDEEHRAPTVRNAIDAARTPNQDSPR